MDLRQYPRLYTSLTMKYQVGPLESAESWNGDGILKNISPAGVYFTCEDNLPLEPGDVRDFSITTTSLYDMKSNRASHFKAMGMVVRVERPAMDQAACGIAVKFLTPLQLSSV